MKSRDYNGAEIVAEILASREYLYTYSVESPVVSLGVKRRAIRHKLNILEM